MRKVYLDANFVLKSIEWKIDLFGELRRVLDFVYEVVVLDRVVEELHKYREHGGKKKSVANIATVALAMNNVKIVKTKGGHTDTLIVKLATKKDVVATQDRGLKTRLKAKGVPLVSIRKKQYLELATW